MKKEDIAQVLNEAKTASWNACITPKLESLRSWFSGAEWKDGLQPYLSGVLLSFRENLEKKDNTKEDDQFIKGQIAMLKQIVDIPMVIGNQISQAEKNKDSSPKGDAGY